MSSTPPTTLRFRLLSQQEAIRAVSSVFGDVRASDIRQQAGRTQDNAGELLVLPSGVAAMLAAMGPLNECDVFLDVGAGIGNVLCNGVTHQELHTLRPL